MTHDNSYCCKVDIDVTLYEKFIEKKYRKNFPVKKTPKK